MADAIALRWLLKKGDYAGARAARIEFRMRFLQRCADETACANAELVFGELVSNAVRHAESEVRVSARFDGIATVHVTDDGNCFSPKSARPQPVEAESGRGLYIASVIASDLIVERMGARCVVTAVLPVSLAPAPAEGAE